MNAGQSNASAVLMPATSSERESAITLGVLNAVSRDPALTQRNIASHLGIALGLANAYLKRCIRKGLVKVSQAPANRYSYYLTPKGFSEKTRLTAEYLSQSLRFFRVVRQQYGDIFDACKAAGHCPILLWGASDVTEIAALCADEHGIVVAGILMEEPAAQELYGLPARHDCSDFANAQAAVITDPRIGEHDLDGLIARFGGERVFAAPILGLQHTAFKTTP